ncbi:uncharacterized protein LOC124153603 isoform X2 [Ischnura elegans]|uniref:uncharacterized protein LOC124153603 isoform X2 n=1 Tax=Ischnura elegans TaxID=197161 RepID=UPI001ED8884D|nr:uncharacterized protein LOC124153603 isoform X2 [Ischnura elegans]
MATSDCSSDSDVMDLLFDAASREHKELLAALDDVDSFNAQQQTLLHAAVRSGVFDSVARLLGSGGDPFTKDGNGATVLEVALELEAKHPRDVDRRKITHLLQFVAEREKAKRSKDFCNRCSDSIQKANSQADMLSKEVSRLNTSMSKHHFYVKEALDDVKTEFLKTIDDMRSSITLRDNHQINLERKVDSLVKDLKPLKEFIEGLQRTVGQLRGGLIEAAEIPLSQALEISSSDETSLRSQCIRELMNRTELIRRTSENLQTVRGFYEKLYDNDLQTRCILRYIQFKSEVQVVVDCDSYYVGGIKDNFVDLSGRRQRGRNFYTFPDTIENVVYLGAQTGSYWSEDRVVGQLAMSLAIISICLAFKNKGLPYEITHKSLSMHYREIVEKTRSGWSVEDRDFDEQFRKWANSECQLEKEAYTIAAVPGMVATFGKKDGILRTRRKMKSLMEFYEENVTPVLKREAYKKKEPEITIF